MDRNYFQNFDFFKALLEALPNPIFYKDRAGYYRFCNVAFLNFTGLKLEAIIDKTVFDIAPPELAKVYDDADQSVYDEAFVQVYEARILHADGTLHDVIFSKAVHFDQNDEPLGIVGIIQDVTEKKEALREVEMLHKLKDVFLYLNQAMISYENEHELLNALLRQVQSIFVKCTQATVLELSHNDILTVLAHVGFYDSDMSDFQIPLSESFILKDFNDEFLSAHIVNDIVAFTNQGHKEVALPLSNKPVQSSLVVPIWINDKLKWIFSLDSSENNIYNETDRKVADYIREQLPLLYRIYELYLRILRLSQFDELTKLINRRHFDTLHENLFKQSMLENKQYALVLFDLDGLKHVNDLYGHQAGDAYLIAFSNWLKSAPIEGECYARLGGDEFVGLFPNVPADLLTLKLNDLRKSFEKIAIVDIPHVYYGSFSFGVSSYPDDTDNRSKLFQIADVRMYKDKKR